ncbi:MAG TPA: hypothetical protein VIZ18_10990 [Ktedonobacteraceae bacterium]
MDSVAWSLTVYVPVNPPEVVSVTVLVEEGEALGELEEFTGVGLLVPVELVLPPPQAVSINRRSPRVPTEKSQWARY